MFTVIIIVLLAVASLIVILSNTLIQQVLKSKNITHKNNIIMENDSQNKNTKLWLKILLIFIISLLLLIPQSLIQNLIDERAVTENLANEEVSAKWGNSRQMLGPVLFIPGDSAANNIYILPEQLDIQTNVKSQTLHRGIYDFMVFEAPVQMKGRFALPKELHQGRLSHLRPERARLLFAIDDFKGFTDYPSLTFRGQSLELNAEDLKIGDKDALSCFADISTMLAGDSCDFVLDVPLKGSSAIDFVPVGRTTTVHVASDCTTPSFGGRYLPATREVTDQGFTADWKVLALNTDFPQVLDKQNELSNVGTIDVGLNVPVEQYQQTTRAIKYAYLVILLTFAVVFLVENRRRTPVHPVQYALVGLALILFYTLLLSFSEHLAFWLSYLIAAFMTVGLITTFIHGLLHQRSATAAVGGLLGVLYLFIYVLMQIESYALLVGSLGIFVILAIAMYASQKINWYQK